MKLFILAMVIASIGFCQIALAKRHKVIKPVKEHRNLPQKKIGHAKFKTFNENNPINPSDNTITVITGEEEIELPVKKTWNQEHLRIFQNREVSITSTMDPETGTYIVTNIRPFTAE